MNKKSLHNTGISQVLSFALIFALILATITLLYSQAYPLIQTEQQYEEAENVGRSLQLIDSAAELVQTNNAPSQSVQIKPTNSQINIESQYTFTYTISETNQTITTQPESLQYNTQIGTTYTYTADSLTQYYNQQLTMQKPPQMFRSIDNTIQITTENTSYIGPTQSGGIQTITINNQTQQTLQYKDSKPSTVHITVTTPTNEHTTKWIQYFTSQEEVTSCTQKTTTEFTCKTIPYNSISIITSNIEISSN